MEKTFYLKGVFKCAKEDVNSSLGDVDRDTNVHVEIFGLQKKDKNYLQHMHVFAISKGHSVLRT